MLDCRAKEENQFIVFLGSRITLLSEKNQSAMVG